MGNSNVKATMIELDEILNYVDSSNGLVAKVYDGGKVEITQDIDGKVFIFLSSEVSEVLSRSDAEGKPFIQINFKNTNKVLLTDNLVGFKPHETLGLDMSRIPKVVTTPDLQSVFTAIEEAIESEGSESEVEILKRVYQAILTGGEKVGFELSFERKWLNRILASKFRASA